MLAASFFPRLGVLSRAARRAATRCYATTAEEMEAQRRDRQTSHDKEVESIDREAYEKLLRESQEAPVRKMGTTVHFKRTESTKMGPKDVLCPENSDLVSLLRDYAELQRRRGNVEDHHWLTAMAHGAIDHIRKADFPVKSTEDVKRLRLRFLPVSVVKDLTEKVVEFGMYSTIAELEEDSAITARRLFTQLPGLSHRADEFVVKGLRSIRDVMKQPEYRSWSLEQQRQIEYFEHLQCPIPLQEAVLLHMLLADHLHEFDKSFIISETDSVRRREMWRREREVKFLITNHSIGTIDEGRQAFKKVVQALLERVNGAHEWKVWSEGFDSVHLLGRIPCVYTTTKWRQIYLRWVPSNEWVPQLLHETGHARFLKRLTDRASDRRWELQPTKIVNPEGRTVVFRTEEEFFDAIGEPFVAPWDRTEHGPQIHRRNNTYRFKDGQIQEKPRAQRLRNQRPRRLPYHQ
eukprot:Sspe_Gene.10747::Locus_3602_Transcript_1_1_Confidence_1.000_Length_1446::g.10747::m.10747